MELENRDNTQTLSMAQETIKSQNPNNQQRLTPLDLLTMNATSDDKKKEVSLKSLKKSEIDKIMAAFEKCKKTADSYYKSTIEPCVKRRENAYNATEKYYNERFPHLSETSRFCSRDIKTTIDWMIPSLAEALSGGDDPVDIQGVNVEDDEKAKKIQQLLKYQLQRKNSYGTFIDAILKDALKLNFAVAKVYWKHEEDRERYKMMASESDPSLITLLYEEVQKGTVEIIKIEPVKEAPDLRIITFEKVIVKANYPVISYMPPSELRVTPDGNSISNAKFTAHRKIVSGDYLKRQELVGIYNNIDVAIEKSVSNNKYTSYDTDKNKEIDTVSEKLSDDDLASKQVELYEGYIQVDYNNDGIYEDLIVHAIGNTPIRIVENDLKTSPFFICYSELSPAVAFNEDESFVDNILQQQDLKTAIFRQIITNVAKNNAPQKFVSDTNVDMDALIDNEEIIPVRGDVGGAIFIPPQLPLSGAAMTVVEYAQNEIEAQSGSTRYNQGLDSNSLNKTATGITAIMGSAEKRMKHLALQIAENFIIPLTKYLVLLNQKYLGQEEMIRISNSNVVINKKELDIDYDLVINVGKGAGTREAQIQYLMILINQIYPILAQQGIVTQKSWYEIVKDLLEKMGIRNTANYLLDPNSEEAQQMKQQAEQVQAAAKEEQVQLLTAKANLELQKQQMPRVSVNFEDLPVDAKTQFIQSKLGVTTTPEAILQKEMIDRRVQR